MDVNGELSPTNVYMAISEIQRSPANIIPDDELEVEPARHTLWFEDLIVEDDRGVMVGMREQLRRWQEVELYSEQWDLESTGLYRTPDLEAKKRYLQKNLLRYLDKRLAGEVRRAEKNSTLHRVGKVQNALRPKAEAKLSEKIKVKFRAKVLQGRAFMIVSNPWVDNRTTVTLSGDVEISMSKSLKDFGINTRVRYQVDDGLWLAELDKSITRKITARISSSQNDKTLLFDKESNKTIQLMFNHSF